MNLLFLYTDEQRRDSLTVHGNRDGVMPNVDALASRSTVFDRAYCAEPVCTPGRGSIVSGLYPHAHGATVNNMAMRRDVCCLPEMVTPSRYVCGHFGKWHLGDEIFAQHGFTDWRGTEDTYHMSYSPPVKEFGPERSSYHHWLVSHGVVPDDISSALPPERRHPAYENRFFRDQMHRLPEELSRPKFLADQAIDFIGANRRRSWMLYVNFLEPHPPFHSCRDSLYDPADVVLPEAWKWRPGANMPLGLRLRSSEEGANERLLRETVARYWGMCSLVDAHVGRILSALTAAGLDDNTLIVFTTDHGDMMGSHGLKGKGCMYEESAGVPLLVHMPGQTEQRTIGCPVSHIDIVPTLLEAMGEKPQRGLHGKSLASLIDGRDEQAGRDVFITWKTGADEVSNRRTLRPGQEAMCTIEEARAADTERMRTVIAEDGWKFTVNWLGIHELYDLGNDPNELRNVAGDRRHRDRVVDMSRRIAAWQRRVGDPHTIPEVKA